MPENHAEHGPSGLKYKHPDTGCPHWRNDKFANTAAAEDGTHCHEYMEEWSYWITGQREGADFKLPELTEEQETNVGECQRVVEPYIRQAEKVGLEEKVTITNADGEEITWGTSDVVLVTGKHLTLIDYKFGVGYIDTPDKNMQAKAYVAGAFQSYPEAETAQFIFLIPKRGEVLRHTFKRDELPTLVAEVDRVVKAAQDPDSPYNPSEDTCVFCGEKPKCPAINTAVATISKEYGELELPVEFHSSAITDPSQMAKALQAANLMKRWADSVKHHAMEMVLNGEQIPGYHLKSRQGKRTVRDVQSAWAVMQNILSLEDFLPACSISITELEKAVKEMAPRGKKKALVEEVFETLQDGGVLYRGSETSYLSKITK